MTDVVRLRGRRPSPSSLLARREKLMASRERYLKMIEKLDTLIAFTFTQEINISQPTIKDEKQAKRVAKAQAVLAEVAVPTPVSIN